MTPPANLETADQQSISDSDLNQNDFLSELPDDVGNVAV